jgi:hypothetical protein
MRHAATVVFVALALAVALMAMASFYVLASLTAAAAAVVLVRSLEANEVRRDFRAPFADTWDAAIDAIGQTGFAVGEPTWYAATEGTIRAGDAVVRIERHPGDVVRVRVRIGSFATSGRLRRAALILEQVAQRVGS